VIGVTRIKPLDRSLAGALSGRHVAVVEEHNVHGGLADAVSNLLDAEGVEHRIERVGIPDRFGESGKPTDLLHSVGLSAEALTGTLRAWSQNPSMSQRRTQ
jgi:transketolase